MASAAADATRRRSGSSATTDPALLVLPGKRARKAVDYQVNSHSRQSFPSCKLAATDALCAEDEACSGSR